MKKPATTVSLNGYSMSLEKASLIARGALPVLPRSIKKEVDRSREVIEQIVSGDNPVYGVNTGFGYFANKQISTSRLKELQKHFVRSHAGGYGPSLSTEETRLALALRLNLLIKGFSGVRFELCETILKFLENEIYPIIPEYGSVGASGDLIPLAHLALPLIGEGKVSYQGKVMSAKNALKLAGLAPIELAEKEGLSFVNGTEIMQAVGGMALAAALKVSDRADRIAALSFEALGAHITALDERIHLARGQKGQIETAKNIRGELSGSYLYDKSLERQRVQDPYSLRCSPQIHGPSKDALTYAKEIIEREFNAVTDNPLVFAEDKQILSGGNFHGQALAISFDFASIAVSELANVADRRIELLMNPQTSKLPAFLAKDEGFNSGYMVLQYLSASLVNENKLLANPASTDSIPGNVGIEDHVSMGMTSARKLKKVVENTRTVLSLEMLAAAQAIYLAKVKKLGKGTQKTYDLVRKLIPPLKKDRIVSIDVGKAVRVFEEL